MYLNGINVASATGTNFNWLSFDNSNYYFVLGRAGDNSPRYLNSGGIRHFVRFNKVLSSTEVNDIYTNST
jgi:hypothetical protein